MKIRKKKYPNAEKPITLEPLTFDEAVADILKVKPKEPEHKDNQKAEKGKHERD